MKNWKNNRGCLINFENKDLSELNEYSDNYQKKILNLYEFYFYINQNIKIKRIINYEFKDIIYINNNKIKDFFKWEKY